jgi:hypothetical protein
VYILIKVFKRAILNKNKFECSTNSACASQDSFFDNQTLVCEKAAMLHKRMMSSLAGEGYKARVENPSATDHVFVEE